MSISVPLDAALRETDLRLTPEMRQAVAGRWAVVSLTLYDTDRYGWRAAVHATLETR